MAAAASNMSEAESRVPAVRMQTLASEEGLAATLVGYSLDGIDFSLPGNGGQECLNYISG